MPSWYTLYLAVIGAYFLLRHHETRHARLARSRRVSRAGFPSRCKITGVWYVLAVFVYLVYCRPGPTRAIGELACESRLYRLGARASRLRCRLSSLVLFAGRAPDNLGPAEIVNFLLPVAAVCAPRSGGGGASRPRAGNLTIVLVRLVLPFLAASSHPWRCSCVPYVATGSLGDLYPGPW